MTLNLLAVEELEGVLPWDEIYEAPPSRQRATTSRSCHNKQAIRTSICVNPVQKFITASEQKAMPSRATRRASKEDESPRDHIDVQISSTIGHHFSKVTASERKRSVRTRGSSQKYVDDECSQRIISAIQVQKCTKHAGKRGPENVEGLTDWQIVEIRAMMQKDEEIESTRWNVEKPNRCFCSVQSGDKSGCVCRFGGFKIFDAEHEEILDKTYRSVHQPDL